MAVTALVTVADPWVKVTVSVLPASPVTVTTPPDALASAANMLRAGGWQGGHPFGQGTANFNVLSVWNDSGNYQRAIAYAAAGIDAGS